MESGNICDHYSSIEKVIEHMHVEQDIEQRLEMIKNYETLPHIHISQFLSHKEKFSLINPEEMKFCMCAVNEWAFPDELDVQHLMINVILCVDYEVLSFSGTTTPARRNLDCNDKLLNLPDDLIRSILSKTSFKDIVHIGSLNRSWNTELRRLVSNTAFEAYRKAFLTHAQYPRLITCLATLFDLLFLLKAFRCK